MKPNVLLIVDDEPSLRALLAEQMRRLGFTTITAENGARALEIFREQQIDTIISDIEMPEMNGLEFLAELRASGSEVPFIIVAGHGDNENAVEALRLGATDFLDKPFDSRVFEEAVRRALALNSALKGIESEVDLAYLNSDLPEDSLRKWKAAKRSVAMMRKDLKIYWQYDRNDTVRKR
jgi:DNA-binding NtrC family response regulator